MAENLTLGEFVGYRLNGLGGDVLPAPKPATQAEVGAGTEAGKFVAPDTLRALEKTRYGTSATAAATAAKVATVANFVRFAGAIVVIKFSAANTAANPTLNVNGTGAAPIYCAGANIDPAMIGANIAHLFQFNGTQWELLNPTVSGFPSDTYDTLAWPAASGGTVGPFQVDGWVFAQRRSAATEDAGNYLSIFSPSSGRALQDRSPNGNTNLSVSFPVAKGRTVGISWGASMVTPVFLRFIPALRAPGL